MQSGAPGSATAVTGSLAEMHLLGLPLIWRIGTCVVGSSHREHRSPPSDTMPPKCGNHRPGQITGPGNDYQVLKASGNRLMENFPKEGSGCHHLNPLVNNPSRYQGASGSCYTAGRYTHKCSYQSKPQNINKNQTQSNQVSRINSANNKLGRGGELNGAPRQQGKNQGHSTETDPTFCKKSMACERKTKEKLPWH